MSKFTPGEWEVDVIYGDHYVVFGDDHTVADCFGSEGNARLIAAAPEMYELLNALVHREYDNTVTTVLISKAQELLARIDGTEEQS